jgi:hypothetical protein
MKMRQLAHEKKNRCFDLITFFETQKYFLKIRRMNFYEDELETSDDVVRGTNDDATVSRSYVFFFNSPH